MVRFTNKHTAYEPHSVLNVELEEHIVSKAGLTSRTASAVQGSANAILTLPDKVQPGNSF